MHLTEATRVLTPGELVVAADVERRLLLAEAASLDARADAGDLDASGQERMAEVKGHGRSERGGGL